MLARRLLSIFLLSASACAPVATGESTRSPTVDYPPPPAQTSDGQIVGADGVPPEVKLRTGVQAGSGGVTPSERPGKAEEPNASEDPFCKGIGMDDAAWKARCKPDKPKASPAPKP